ncbi:hypothetical protein AHAS_Ahas11G0044600 [Arachis hypogaea]
MINSFYEKLEEGGYGIRYKASLHDGRQVAVKILKEPKENVEEFVNEIGHTISYHNYCCSSIEFVMTRTKP